MADIGGEEFAVDGTVDHPRSVDAVVAQRCEEGLRRPVAVWRVLDQTPASGTPASERSHVGLDPGLVDEDEARWIGLRLMRLPAGSLAGDVRSVLLGREHGFF